MARRFDLNRRAVLHSLAVALGGTTSGCQAIEEQTKTRTPSVSIAVPSETRLAEPLPVTVRGLGSNATVELTVRPTDPSLESYRWSKEFTANDAGSFEASVGSRGEDNPRMVLAELAEGPDGEPGQFHLRGKEVLDLRVRLTRGETVLAEETTTRIARHPGSRGRTVQATDITGIVYEPVGDGPHPPVVVLHGSRGIVPEEFCHMLATRGFWTLGLQYFGPAEHLPDELADVPIEYFERAVEWGQSQTETSSDEIGFVGLSRGVEAALLTAAAIDSGAAVVGYSGSGWIAPGVEEASPVPWTRHGDPIIPRERVLTFWSHFRDADCDAVSDCRYTHPHQPCHGVTCALDHVRTSARAVYDDVMLPVEEVSGPVTLLSGLEDSVWNAPLYSEMALHRIARHEHTHPVGHHAYDGAGHIFHRPYYPNPLRGGTPEQNGRAAVRAWVQTLETLASMS